MIAIALVSCGDENGAEGTGENETERLLQNRVVGHGWEFVGMTDESQEKDWYGMADFYIKDNQITRFADREGSLGAYFMNAFEYTYEREKDTLLLATPLTQERYKFINYAPESGLLTVEHTVRRALSYADDVSEKEQTWRLLFQRIEDARMKHILDEYENGPYKLIVGNDGTPVAKGAREFAPEDFKRHLVGSGWKFVEGHIILPDMTIDVSPLDPTGWEPAEYFIGENEATKYVFAEEPPTFRQHTGAYSYNDNTFLLDGDGFAILSYDETTQTLTVIDKKSVIQFGQHFHFLEFYQRMTDEELAKTQAEHATAY